MKVAIERQELRLLRQEQNVSMIDFYVDDDATNILHKAAWYRAGAYQEAESKL